MKGRSRAKIMKMTTNTTPVVARALCRAARGSEMVAVDKVKSL